MNYILPTEIPVAKEMAPCFTTLATLAEKPGSVSGNYTINVRSACYSSFRGPKAFWAPASYMHMGHIPTLRPTHINID